MTFDDFLAIAKQEYKVYMHRLRTTTGVKDAVLLVRPGVGGQDAFCCPRPNLDLDDPMPSETIARVCRALHMRPGDFGLFIG